MDTSTNAEPLPGPVNSLVAAINRGDTEAFLAHFTEGGEVDDWGRRVVGHTAIRRWSDREFIGAHGRMKVKDVVLQGNRVKVTADWASERFTGSSRFDFVVDGDQVRSMRISGATALTAIASGVLRIIRRWGRT